MPAAPCCLLCAGSGQCDASDGNAALAQLEPAGGAEQPAPAAQHLGPAAAGEPPAAGSGGDHQERQRAFALLQPICSALLLQRAEPQRMTELLTGEALGLPAAITPWQRWLHWAGGADDGCECGCAGQSLHRCRVGMPACCGPAGLQEAGNHFAIM